MNETDNSKYNKFRKNRVKRFKRIIIGLVFLLIALPDFLCLYLFSRINETDRSIDTLISEIEALRQTEVVYNETLAEPIDNEDISGKHYDVIYKTLSDEEAYPDYQRIYITFDDGPSSNTDRILDILNEYNVKATFFVVSNDKYMDDYTRIVNEGHTLGIHSNDHVYSNVYANVDSFSNDIDSVNDFVYNVVGEYASLYRFPGGSSNTLYKGDKAELVKVLNEKNLTYYDWNVTGNDATYGGLSKYQIADNVIKGIGNKTDAVVLLHDAGDKNSTVEALPIIFETLQSKENVIFLPLTDKSNTVQHISFESEGD